MHAHSELSGNFNLYFARLYIQTLLSLDVTYFCIAPGSRSSPLAIACAENQEIKTMVHFDERGLGFHALGASHIFKKPACLIVTSGTAVANLLPAVMEAHEDRIPLILLTADRPPELQHCGANQTCDQKELFLKYTRLSLELPPPSQDLKEDYVRSSFALAVHKATASPLGPVHINCAFRDPLVQGITKEIPKKAPVRKAPIHYETPPHIPREWASLLNQKEKGVIILGSLPPYQDLQDVFDLSERLQWPILADILSQGRCYGQKKTLIPFYDALLKNTRSFQPDCILHVGDRLVSKILQEWLLSQKEIPYLQLTSHAERQDPEHQVTFQVTSPIACFCKTLLTQLEEKTETHWLLSWQEASRAIACFLQGFFNTAPLSGASLFFQLQNTLPEECPLFIGNSLPIRDGEHFFFPKNPRRPIFGQRGVSGIDGNIARLSGSSQSFQKKVIGIIGDQTFLHDINSLSFFSKIDYPVLLIVLNNQGGRIFSALPVQKKFPHFIDSFFAAAHSYHFEHAAHLFHLPYIKTSDHWYDALQYPGSLLLEIPIQPEEERLSRELLTKELQALELSLI